MKKTAIAIAALFLINMAYAQQKSGKYTTAEDYKQGKFADKDPCTALKWTASLHFFIECKRESKPYAIIMNTGETWYSKKDKNQITTLWGFKVDGDTYRIYSQPSSKEKKPFRVLKDAAICLYGDNLATKEEDKEGNIKKVTNRSMVNVNPESFYISKTIDGEMIELTKSNLATMVQDDAKLAAYVNSKEYSKKDEISIINQYNASHKK